MQTYKIFDMSIFNIIVPSRWLVFFQQYGYVYNLYMVLNIDSPL